MSAPPEILQPGNSGASLEHAVLRKTTRRLIPFLFLLYIIAYVDRVNVGFAQLQMKMDLGFNDAAYGLGAGIFFIGYFLFEIPSNLILERVGARFWIARIMITWGMIASAMMWVKSPLSFYSLRFLLGISEAGFFPGIILYLTYWFPAPQRARAIALFMTATSIAGVVGGPLSGLLLNLDGMAGLKGWQWLFLVEGIPAVVMGVVVLFYLTDRPEQAAWLKPEERRWLSDRMLRERQEKQRSHPTLRHALTDGRVWMFGFMYFLLVIAFYGISLWLPQLIKGSARISNLAVGMLSAIPYVIAAAGMVVIGSHSDRTRERRWHVAVPMFAGAAGLTLGAYSHTLLPVLLSFSLATLGVWGALGPFWTLPTAMLGGTAAAGGIALINSIGNLGGFAGPYLIGAVKNATQSFTGALLALAASLLLGAGLVLVYAEPGREGERESGRDRDGGR